MFISTPFVRLVVNRLFRQGKIDSQQRIYLVKQDRHINILIIIAVFMLAVASLFL